MSEGEPSDDDAILESLIREHGYVEGWRRHAELQGAAGDEGAQSTAQALAALQAAGPATV